MFINKNRVTKLGRLAPKKKDVLIDERRLMKMNRALSGRWAIIILTVCIDIGFYVLINFLINCGAQLLMERSLSMNAAKFFAPQALLDGYRLRGAYIVLLLFLLVFDIIFVFRMRVSMSEEEINVGQHGDERWTTIEEIQDQYKEIKDKKREYAGMPGIIISRHRNRLYIDDSFVNNLILGITRSGKGEMFVFPNIDVYSRAEIKPSMVVVDPKMELYKSSKGTLEKRGYEVHILNIIKPIASMGFNILSMVTGLWKEGRYGEAETLANTIATMIFDPDSIHGNNRYFYEAGRDATVALILAHVEDCLKADELYGTHENEKKINMYSIVNTFTELARQVDDDVGVSRLDEYFSRRPELDRAKLKYATIEMGDSRVRGNVYSTMMTKLSIFTYEDIAKMTAESTIDLKDIGFGEKPMAVFIAIPDYDKSKNVIVSMFIRQVYFVLSLNCAEKGHCERPVRFICDELKALPPIESFDTIITMCLGRWISFDLVLQSYAQIKDAYGNAAETIIGNCANQIYILSDDEQTAESFSKLIGYETITDISRSGKKLEIGKTITESTNRRPLLTANQLMELKPGECVIKRTTKRTDLDNHTVRPFPIYNREENGTELRFRHDYLTEDFPDPDEINFSDICTESRSHIILKEFVWDMEISFDLIKSRKLGEPAVHERMLSDLDDKVMEQLNDSLKRCLGEDFAFKFGITSRSSVRNVVEIVNSAVEDVRTRNAIITIVGFDAEREGLNVG